MTHEASGFRGVYSLREFLMASKLRIGRHAIIFLALLFRHVCESSPDSDMSHDSCVSSDSHVSVSPGSCVSPGPGV